MALNSYKLRIERRFPAGWAARGVKCRRLRSGREFSVFMGKKAVFQKTIYYLKRNGIRKTWTAVRERLWKGGKVSYCWKPISEEERERQRCRIWEAPYQKKFSIVVPTYRTPEKYLREMIESVLAQTYPDWELLLADASGDDSVRTVVEQYPDKRICYIALEKNAGIAENTNVAILKATGDYIGLLDHDDLLTADALYEMAGRMEEEEKAGRVPQLLYSDEDKCDGEAEIFYEPHFKEKFNLDLILSNNYICHFMVMKRELMQQLLERGEYNGAQDYDLVLRAAFALSGREEAICHIPKVLYHWRCHSLSTAENPKSKLYAYEAGRRAVQDFVNQKGWKAEVQHTEHLGFYRVEYPEGVFAVRAEVGAVGGAVVKGGKIVGGRMKPSGEVFYQGLPASFSGYMHRAALAQDAEALDIRNMKVRSELQGLYKEVMAEENTDILEKSLKLSEKIREAGYVLLYLPGNIRKV